MLLSPKIFAVSLHTFVESSLKQHKIQVVQLNVLKENVRDFSKTANLLVMR